MRHAGVETARLDHLIGVAASLGLQKLSEGEDGVGATAGGRLAKPRLGSDGIRRAAALAMGQHLAQRQGRIVAGPRGVRTTVVGRSGRALQPA